MSAEVVELGYAARRTGLAGHGAAMARLCAVRGIRVDGDGRVELSVFSGEPREVDLELHFDVVSSGAGIPAAR